MLGNGVPFAERGVHDLFTEQAARTPDAVALEFGSDDLSYRALESRTNQLAHLLGRHGIGPDRRVAILMQRSIPFVVSILGTLKAGGAYVPLDPSYPAERLQMMLEESGATVLLTQDAERSLVTPPDGCTVLRYDAIAAGLSEESAQRPPVASNPTHLAYVLFTSGSTGRPKGVAMPHGPLLHLIRWQCARSGLGAGDRTLQFSALSFDVSFQELFSTWASGGTVVLVSEDTRRDALALLRLMDEKQIRRLFLPFVALQHIAGVAVTTARYPTALREVITAGEQLKTVPALRTFFHQLPDCSLDNQYGPTETHVVTAYRLPATVDDWATLPSIGTPIPSARIYLLDEDGQPVADGDPGELYVGGDCLARNYLHRPEETAERFRPDPFRARAGARMYRTGDLARRNADGTLDFLGRADHQVKIRGYRVELGEVEAVLARHPSIREAVVFPDQDGPHGNQSLAAVVQLRPDASFAPDTIRAYVTRHLPEYMVPSTVDVVDAFPLTPSGKVDRKALAARPRPVQATDPSDAPGPRDDLEQFLVDLWRDTLGRPTVGIRDDFFALGGHSILAAEMLVRVSTYLGRDLPLSLLADTPTIEALAEKLRRGSDEAGWSPLVPIRPVGDRTKPPLFCVHGGGLEVLGFRALAEQLDPDQPVYGLQWAGLDGRSMPSRIEAIAELYLQEIRSVQRTGPYLLAGHCYGAVVALEMARQLRAAGETTDLLVMFDPPALDSIDRPLTVGRAAWSAFRDSWRSPRTLAHKLRVLLGLRTRAQSLYSLITGRPLPATTRQDMTWKPGMAAPYRLFGRRIPMEVRPFDALQHMNRALRRYRLAAHTGSVLVFQTETAPDFALPSSEEGETTGAPDGQDDRSWTTYRIDAGHDDIVHHPETATHLRSSLGTVHRRTRTET
jgi:amino acid adenylation domain-containing protein